jgi:hypothetical protein
MTKHLENTVSGHSIDTSKPKGVLKNLKYLFEIREFPGSDDEEYCCVGYFAVYKILEGICLF